MQHNPLHPHTMQTQVLSIPSLPYKPIHCLHNTSILYTYIHVYVLYSIWNVEIYSRPMMTDLSSDRSSSCLVFPEKGTRLRTLNPYINPYKALNRFAPPWPGGLAPPGPVPPRLRPGPPLRDPAARTFAAPKAGTIGSHIRVPP